MNFDKGLDPSWKLLYDHLEELTHADILAPESVLLVQWWHCARAKCFNLKMKIYFGCHGDRCILNNSTKKTLSLLKALVWGNSGTYGFLHPLLYLFSYSSLSIWIFGVRKSRPQTALMTWKGSATHVLLLTRRQTLSSQEQASFWIIGSFIIVIQKN